MTQLRRQVTPEHAALLASGVPLYSADLFSLTLTGGLVLRWTNADRLITYGATTWLIGPGISRSRITLQAGIVVDECEVTLIDSPQTTISGQTLRAFANRGGFDGALVQIWRADSASPSGPPVGLLHRFTGRVADIGNDRPNQITLTVRSWLDVLDQPLPRNVWQAPCSNQLFDTGCGLARAAFLNSSTAATASDPKRLQFGHTLPQAAGYFDLGTVTFNSGANQGIKRSVRAQSASLITLMLPLPFDVQPGDLFDIVPGCDRRASTCATKFSNKPRFRGAPLIPAAETVLG